MIWSDDLVERLHQEMYALSKRERFIQHALDARRVLAREIEAATADRLAGMGYYISHTSHKAHYDIMACNETAALRIEIKAALWSKVRRGFCFNLRDNQADVLILCC